VHREPLRYHRVYRSIAERIASGELSRGDRLQGERDLSTAFGVGRTTVRRALAELERDGLVESQPGRGSFVAGGPLSESSTLMGLSELGAARGLRATLTEAELFGIAPGAPVFHLERVRFLDGLEVAVADSLVPEARAPGLDRVDFTGASLYAELDARSASPVRADFTAWAAGADERVAALLAIAPGDPVLETSTRALDVHGRVVETSMVIYRADRYRLQTSLSRRRRRAR
jgi:GntR family transcriptional regulator